MSAKGHIYQAWDESLISEEKGNRILHYHLRSTSSSPLLAAVAREKSHKHFVYTVSKEYLEMFGSSPSINAHTKWTRRDHVKDWLVSLMRKDNCSTTNSEHKGSGSIIKRGKSLQEDLIMRYPKKPRSSRVRQKQESGSSDVVQLSEPNSNQRAYFEVGDNIEILCQDNGILCQDTGMPGCWFRCKVVKIKQNCSRIQYNDVENVKGSGKLEKWIFAPRLAPADKLSLRYRGRLTIRPCPEEEPPTSFEVGAAVDAWWSNGWWEGFILTGVSLSSSNNQYHVFFPGQRKFLILPRKYLRVSREWVDDAWVPIKSQPDVLSFIFPYIK